MTEPGNRLVAAVALAFALCAPGAPRAEDPAPPPQDGAWYGGQTLALDAGGFALIAAGALVGAETGATAPAVALAVTGWAVYFAGAPLVHAAHGGAATASVLRRLLLPLGGAVAVGGLAVLLTPSGSSDVCHDQRACAGAAGGTLGSAAGMVTAVVWDAVVAHEPRASAAAGPPPATVLPLVALSRGGAAFGLRLAF